MKKHFKILLIFIGFIFFYLYLDNTDQLYQFEEKLLLIMLNEQPTSIELNLVNQSIKNVYYHKQVIHKSETAISLEQFVELVESNLLIQARNSDFHNINDCHNVKYLSRDGTFEYIVKVQIDENGKMNFLQLVKNPMNQGTYNFFNQEGQWWQRTLHHIDVVFWILYGTSIEDSSQFHKRLDFYLTREAYCGG